MFVQQVWPEMGDCTNLWVAGFGLGIVVLGFRGVSGSGFGSCYRGFGFRVLGPSRIPLERAREIRRDRHKKFCIRTRNEGGGFL